MRKAEAHVGWSGSRKPCAVCGEIIPADEVEYEAETEIAGSSRLVHFHFLPDSRLPELLRDLDNACIVALAINIAAYVGLWVTMTARVRPFVADVASLAGRDLLRLYYRYTFVKFTAGDLSLLY